MIEYKGKGKHSKKELELILEKAIRTIEEKEGIINNIVWVYRQLVEDIIKVKRT